MRLLFFTKLTLTAALIFSQTPNAFATSLPTDENPTAQPLIQMKSEGGLLPNDFHEGFVIYDNGKAYKTKGARVVKETLIFTLELDRVAALQRVIDQIQPGELTPDKQPNPDPENPPDRCLDVPTTYMQVQNSRQEWIHIQRRTCESYSLKNGQADVIIQLINSFNQLAHL